LAQKWRAVSINNKLIVVFSGITMLATVVYSVVAGWTLREIHSGGIDTHALAEGVTLTLRPRILIAGISPSVQTMVNGKLETQLADGKLVVAPTIYNYGPSPAKNVRWFVYDNISTREQAGRLAYKELFGEPKVILSKPGGEIYGGNFLTITGIRQITPEELSGLESGTLWATFSILIQYDDDGGKTHHAEYCDLFTLKPYNDICPWPVQND
jgi:hypothetical protein